ncbi:uncharacterized protein LOC112505498 [Cynara cardunculus var. scolymus]|uniref:Oxidative stress 3 n=1 Tax=Cynara cardunculus var. scolymus TaxID=59895 RepID=A0A103D8Q4_CYNCS|nr:uncharacterized protein LOC112505498 [Cynara cardunculus var. scolymus]KVD99855.1 hypothetical protein Ccrd_024106 [Cynara cardunculus var. scolymus]
MGFISSEKKSQLEQTRWVLTEVVHVTTDGYGSDIVEECSNDLSNSLESSSSSEMLDNTSTSSSLASSSSVLSHTGPLYELSELMKQLPIKRGLSKYYQGKSESFGSLANLKSFQDLAKRSRWSTKSPFRSQSQNQTLIPKGIIVKNKKNSLFSSLGKIKMDSLLDTISVQNHF